MSAGCLLAIYDTYSVRYISRIVHLTSFKQKVIYGRKKEHRRDAHTRSGTKIGAHIIQEKRSRGKYTKMEANDSYMVLSVMPVYASIWIRKICVWSSALPSRRHSRHRQRLGIIVIVKHNKAFLLIRQT